MEELCPQQPAIRVTVEVRVRFVLRNECPLQDSLGLGRVRLSVRIRVSISISVLCWN